MIAFCPATLAITPFRNARPISLGRNSAQRNRRPATSAQVAQPPGAEAAVEEATAEGTAHGIDLKDIVPFKTYKVLYRGDGGDAQWMDIYFAQEIEGKDKWHAQVNEKHDYYHIKNMLKI